MRFKIFAALAILAGAAVFPLLALGQEPEPIATVTFEGSADLTITVEGEGANLGNDYIITVNLPTMHATAHLFGSIPPPPAPPEPISDLSAASGDSLVTLTWSAAAGASSYDVYQSLETGANFSLVEADVSSPYDATGLSNGTEYFFHVVANGPEGSSQSNEDSATPADAVAPAAPTNLGLVRGDNTIALDWDDNAEGDLAGYKIYRSTGAGVVSFVLIATIGPTSEYDDDTADNGTFYRFRVTAFDTSGNESEVSNTAHTLPFAVTDLSAASGDTLATLTWSGGIGTNTFDAYVSTTSGSGFSLVEAGVESPYDVESLTNGTEYFFKLVQNGSGGTVDSNEDSATPADVTAPDAPSAPTLTPGDTEIEVTLPSLTGDVVGFRVYTSATEGGSYVEDTSTPQTSSWTIDGLPNDTIVWVKISAVDEADNESALSAASSATPASAGIDDLDDLASGLFWYSPRLENWTLTTAPDPDTVSALPDALGIGPTLGKYVYEPDALIDEFGAGLHGLGIVSNGEAMYHLTGTPAVDDWSLVVVVGNAADDVGHNTPVVRLNAVQYYGGDNSFLLAWYGNKLRARIDDGGTIIVAGLTEVHDRAIVRVERYRGTGGGDGYLKIYTNGVLEAEEDGLSMSSYTGRRLYIGTTQSPNGPTEIGDVYLCSDEADGVLAEAFLADLYGITLP